MIGRKKRKSCVQNNMTLNMSQYRWNQRYYACQLCGSDWMYEMCCAELKKHCRYQYFWRRSKKPCISMFSSLFYVWHQKQMVKYHCFLFMEVQKMVWITWIWYTQHHVTLRRTKSGKSLIPVRPAPATEQREYVSVMAWLQLRRGNMTSAKWVDILKKLLCHSFIYVYLHVISVCI